ncbi:MAG: ROK family transcriptional regulator [Anaerolineales bacterium]|nr:ROK family transcriptional regulator [Anaerolineales bacterium]
MKRSGAVDSASIRERNLSLVLNHIRQAGTVSRAALVRHTGLSAGTISSLVNILLENEFVHEAGPGKSSGGRRPILLQFNYKARYLLGIDMGATHILAVLMDLQGCVVASKQVRYDVINDPDGTISTIIQMAQDLLTQMELPPPIVIGMGITLPTPLAGENLDRLTTIYFPAWENRDIRASILPHFNIPIYIENDANAGAIAEKWWGNGRDYSNLAYIKLGTGVGSGLILNNEIFRGNGGTAGEIGHTTIDPTGPTCRCGNQGCLEGMVGIPAIITEAQQRLRKDRPNWVSNTPLTINSIIRAALSGDPTARSIIENAGSILGIGTANLVNVFNPGLVVLGGDLVAAGDLLLNAVRATVIRRAMPKASSEVKITVSSLGDDAVAIGAATLAMQNAFQPSNLMQTLEGSVVIA